MGCVTSAPEQRAPPQPLTHVETLKNAPAKAVKGEPILCDNMVNPTEFVSLEIKQTATHKNGKTPLRLLWEKLLMPLL